MLNKNGERAAAVTNQINKSHVTRSKSHASLSCNKINKKDTGGKAINSGTNKKDNSNLGKSFKATTPPIKIKDKTSAKVVESGTKQKNSSEDLLLTAPKKVKQVFL